MELNNIVNRAAGAKAVEGYVLEEYPLLPGGDISEHRDNKLEMRFPKCDFQFRSFALVIIR